MGFSCGSAGKESTCDAGDLGSFPELGRSPGKGMDTHSSILACRISWIAKSWTRLNDFNFHFDNMTDALTEANVVLIKILEFFFIDLISHFKRQRTHNFYIINIYLCKWEEKTKIKFFSHNHCSNKDRLRGNKIRILFDNKKYILILTQVHPNNHVTNALKVINQNVLLLILQHKNFSIFT